MWDQNKQKTVMSTLMLDLCAAEALLENLKSRKGCQVEAAASILHQDVGFADVFPQGSQGQQLELANSKLGTRIQLGWHSKVELCQVFLAMLHVLVIKHALCSNLVLVFSDDRAFKPK